MPAARIKGRPGRIRIIGGRWRGRKLQVMPLDTLRPTPDRIRETLFNWLQPVIDGAACLDLFAGTGALGFEAASRGAAKVTLVEQDRQLAAALERQARMLNTDNLEIHHANGFDWLENTTETFDLVFLDPPFGKNLAPASCDLLLNRGHLHPHSLVYVECEPGVIDTITATGGFQNYRRSRAGQVDYALLTCEQDNQNQ